MFKGTAPALLVLLLFGAVLGASLFRPTASTALSPATDTLVTTGIESGQGMGGNANSPAPDIDSVLHEIEQREAALEEEQARLAQEWENLQAEQAHLSQEKNALQEEQTRLAQEWEALQTERARLDEERTSLRETKARLRRKEASLAEWEQKLEGRQRLSVVAVVASSLLAVPSVMVLIALMRQGQQMPGGETQWAQASQTHHRERATRHGKVAVATSASTYSGNGRDKESVEHYV